MRGAPVWADGIASAGFAKAYPNLDIPATGRSSLKLRVSADADMPDKFAPAVMFSDRFETNHSFDGSDLRRSKDLAAFFPLSSGMDTRSVSLGDVYIDEGRYYIGQMGEAWSMKQDREKDRDRDGGGRGVSPTRVPEPGSFSLLLIGLATLGIFGLRRREIDDNPSTRMMYNGVNHSQVI